MLQRGLFLGLAGFGLLAGACHVHAGPSHDAEAGPAPTSSARIEAVACDGRSECHAERLVRSVGRDSSGNELAVAMVFLAPKIVFTECRPFETWLMAIEPSGPRRVRLLFQACWREFRPPTIEVLGENRIRYVQFHRTVDRSPDLDPKDFTFDITNTYEVALEPLRVVRSAFREVGPLGEGRETGMDARGVVRESLCSNEGCGFPNLTLLGAPVADDGAFARGGWRATSLGDCAMVLDGRAPEGGEVDPPGDPSAAVRVLLSEGTLFVEVTDDAFVTKGPVVDRLTFTLAWMDDPVARVWKLTMDGALFGQSQLGRERTWRHVESTVVTPTLRRFRLPGVYSEDQKLARFIYEDTDDGKTVHQTLESGGYPGPIETFTSDGRCTSSEGVLRFQRDPLPVDADPDKPLLR